MGDEVVNSALFLALAPVLAIVGISLNLFIRARGGRSFRLHLKGFGIDLNVESVRPENIDCSSTVEQETK